MKLEHFDAVTALKEERTNLCTLLTITRIKLPDEFMDELVSPEHVLAGIHHGALTRIAAIDSELRKLGVFVTRPMNPFTGDAQEWQREHLMYKNAWQRELGGVLINKAHEIDAYVVTAQRVKARSDAWGECVEALRMALDPESDLNAREQCKIVLSRMDELKRRQS